MSAQNPANASQTDPLFPSADAVPPSDVVVTPPVRAALPPRTRRLAVGPLFVWVLIQVGTLALAAGRVPLAARYPATGERYALDLLMGSQVGFAALLFPWLLRDLVASVLAIASCWPALALAVMLSALKPTTLLVAGAFVTLWLAVLTVWRVALASDRSQMIGTAIAATWAIGGPVVWYMRAEFNSPMQSLPDPGPFFGPLTGALSQVNASGWRGGDWLVLAALFALGVGTAWIANVMRVRRSCES